MKPNQNGFALLEVLMYSLILGLFFLGTVTFVLQIIGSSNSILEKNEIFSEQEFTKNKIEWLLARADRIESPTSNASSGVLRFVLNNPTSTSVMFSVSSGTLMLSVSSGTPVALTSPRITVSGFSAQSIISSTTPQIFVQMNLQSPGYKNAVATSAFSYALPK